MRRCAECRLSSLGAYFVLTTFEHELFFILPFASMIMNAIVKKSVSKSLNEMKLGLVSIPFRFVFELPFERCAIWLDEMIDRICYANRSEIRVQFQTHKRLHYTNGDIVWIGSAFDWAQPSLLHVHARSYHSTQLAVCHQYVGKITVRWWFTIERIFTRFKLQLNISPVSPCPYLWKRYFVAEFFSLSRPCGLLSLYLLDDSFGWLVWSQCIHSSHTSHWRLRRCIRELFVELHKINTECILVIKSMRFENVKKCGTKSPKKIAHI